VARELREIAEDGIGRSPRPRATSGGWGEDAPAAGDEDEAGTSGDAGAAGGAPKGRSTSRRQAGMFASGADAPGGRARSHWDDDDDDDGAGDGIMAIPTLGDGDDGGGYGEGGAGAAPVYQQNRSQRLRDLDKEMVSRFGGSHPDARGGVDLGLLARHLTPFEDCAGEADELWDSDTLFADVVAEMQAEADANHE